MKTKMRNNPGMRGCMATLLLFAALLAVHPVTAASPTSRLTQSPEAIAPLDVAQLDTFVHERIPTKILAEVDFWAYTA
jgi:hypothetical protein